ncbi:signal peptidase II [Thalassobellus suaedae]|uniref:Lipoprotein signal peptidase n=1 Tax=Thalassobellus suaedae TaxID=3074124 RepID=A0ABY9XZD3_9FLAO|nr:signal peptidase II [Flavobacteriaceae bacterium HL-DH10]
MTLSKRSLYIFSTIIVTIVIDQISKIIVRKYIDSKEVINLIGEYFSLHNVENEGAFLGMGSDLNPTLRIILLLILPIVVLGYILRYILKDKNLDNWSLFAFASIIGGGIANVFDRVAFGSVTDFFYIRLNDVLRTGIFNMADLSVTTGMIILVIVSFRKKKEQS